MAMLNDELADITTLEAGEVFIGGRYYSLLPIMQETYEGVYQFTILSAKLLQISNYISFRWTHVLLLCGGD